MPQADELVTEFRRVAREKAARLRQGTAAQDHKLHRRMSAIIATLEASGAEGAAALGALLDDADADVAGWVAAHFAALGRADGVRALERLAQGVGMGAFGAQQALASSRAGTLRSPFGVATP